LYYIDLTVNGLIFGGIYALTAVGLTLVYGLLRILHIAHAAVYAFGAFITVIVANATGSIPLGIFVAMVASALLGAAIYRLRYEPLLRHPPYVAMIASMGLFVFMEDGYPSCSASRA
jgi:branched-chain amino acid transport system permease protein